MATENKFYRSMIEKKSKNQTNKQTNIKTLYAYVYEHYYGFR